MDSLPAHLNLSVGRCVYSGPEGQGYIVPGAGSICFIATGEAIGTIQGETTTELAAAGGHGFISGRRGRPATFVGVLPAGGQRLEIHDRAGRSIQVPLNADDGYWFQVSDPAAMLLIRPDGTTKEIQLGRADVS